MSLIIQARTQGGSSEHTLIINTYLVVFKLAAVLLTATLLPKITGAVSLHRALFGINICLVRMLIVLCCNPPFKNPVYGPVMGSVLLSTSLKAGR